MISIGKAFNSISPFCFSKQLNYSRVGNRNCSRSLFINLANDIDKSNPPTAPTSIRNWKNTIEKGRYFELKSLSALERIGLSIAHTGNTSDGKCHMSCRRHQVSNILQGV